MIQCHSNSHQHSTQRSPKFRRSRLAKADKLRALGMNPYAYNWESTHQAAALQLEYADLASGEEVDIPVSSAGRIIARRVMGKLGFERIRAKVRRNPTSAHIRPRLSRINLVTS